MTIKTSVGFTLDNEVVAKLEGMKNKSDFVNSVLKRALMTIEGLDEQIERERAIIFRCNRTCQLL
jgi:hypothetical protein